MPPLSNAPASASGSGSQSNRRWMLSQSVSSSSSSSHPHSHSRNHNHNRPSTASTVQSFTSASPDLASDYDEDEEQDDEEDNHTETEADHDRDRDREEYSGTMSSGTGAGDTTGSTSTSTSTSSATFSRRPSKKIGKSFETLLASDETWVLKETAQVAEPQTTTTTDRSSSTSKKTAAKSSSPSKSTPKKSDKSSTPKKSSSSSSTSPHTPPSSSSSSSNRLLARQQKYLQDNNTTPTPSSDDLLLNTGTPTRRTTTTATTPTRKLSADVPTTPKMSTAAQQQQQQAIPDSIPLYPEPTRANNPGPQPQPSATSSSSTTTTTTAAAMEPSSSSAAAAASTSASTAPPPPTTPTSSNFKDRFTRGFFKRFKTPASATGTATSSSSNTSLNTSYQKQSAASSISLHNTSTRSNIKDKTGASTSTSITRAGPETSSSTAAQSVPNSPMYPSAAAAAAASKEDAANVPKVPDIPAQYASTSSKLNAVTAGPKQDSASSPNNLATLPRAAANRPSTSTRSSSMPPQANRTPRTPPSTSPPPPPVPAPAPPLPVDPSAPGSVSGSAAQPPPPPSSSIPTSTSGAELRSKLQAWESEMDAAFQESARDLDQKTKFTNTATWGPSPCLPELGLGIQVDDDDTNKDKDKLHQQSSLALAVSAPTTPAPSSNNNRSRTSSSQDGGFSRYGPPADQHRPWEKSSSPYMQPADQTDSKINTGVPQALDLDSHDTHISTTATAGATSPTTPSSVASPTRGALSSESSSHAGGRRPRHSTASGASARSFETAAEASTDRAAPVSQADHQYDDAEEGGENTANARSSTTADDSIPPHLRPENSIRLISPSPSASQNLDSLGTSQSLVAARANTLAPISESANSSRSAKAASTSAGVAAPARPVRSRQPPPTTAPSADSTRPTSTPAVVLANASPLGTSSTFHNANALAAAVHRAHDAAADDEEEEIDDGNDDDGIPDGVDRSRARELADKCWNEDETWLHKEKIAEWLGGLGSLNHAARTYYFAKFDFAGMRVDSALRHLCDKLFLKAETQQVDRILAAFSRRFYHCNPLSVYGDAQRGPDIVHAVVFSLLLLNTDLHVADISERMTRQQFVRNTVSAIVESSDDAASASASERAMSPPLVGSSRRSSSIAPMSLSVASNSRRRAGSPAASSGASSTAPSASRPPLVRGSSGGSGSLYGGTSADTTSTGATATPTASASASIIAPSTGELEALLKDMYNAVKADRIRLPNAQDATSLDVDTTGTMSRRKGRNTLAPPSVNSNSNRVSQLKRGSIRGLQGLLGTSNGLRSEENVSPGSQASSIGSRSVGGDSGWLANLQPSPGSSMTSVGSHSQSKPSAWAGAHASGVGSTGGAAVQPASAGFASTLAQNIIKEAAHEQEDGTASADKPGQRAASIDSTVEDIDDDELALIGAPWAKEGVLSRKHYWDSPQRRAKDKNWTEVFVVVEKGTLSMFRFGSSASGSSSGGGGSSSTVKASPLAGASTAVFGGGNWLSNASRLGDFPLAHTLANALPPPGYNRARPHVFALTLPSGAVYFFQAGTEDLVAEWVSTCNYWAARTSRQPLAGGVSNMEYGWNKVLPHLDDDDEYEEDVETYRDDDEEREEVGSLSSRSQRGTINKKPGLRSSQSSNSHGLPVGGGGNSGSTPDESIYSGVMGHRSADSRSVRSGRSGRSFGSRAGAHLYQSWQDAAHLMNPSSSSPHSGGVGASSHKAASISGGRPSNVSSSTRNPFRLVSTSSSSSSSSSPHTNERIHITDWVAPSAPTLPSTLSEESQLDASISYISHTESELTNHNELRTPMLALYSPRRGGIGGGTGGSNNYNKALSNWERKSNYLLAELVKWQGYVESLKEGMRLRGERRDIKQMDVALARADEEMAKMNSSSDGVLREECDERHEHRDEREGRGESEQEEEQGGEGSGPVLV